MKRVDLDLQEHNIKIGDTCGDLKPNVTEDSIFYADGEPIGFYLKEVPTKLKQFAEIANAELLSDRVPKEIMSRGPNSEFYKKLLEEKGMKHVDQFSTILGSCAPRPHMRMPYPRISRVHEVESAQTFIKAMLLVCHEAEELIKELVPNVYEKQLKAIEENVPPRFRFGRLFTSSISNFNIAANYHIDGANLKDCVNVIIAKRSNAKGGNTTVPDYGATVDSSDNSMLVYPAWRNVHGVTPIIPLKEGGYRNTLVFYPLKAFKNYW
jgi:hypothetical protein